jgi:hypothetical protein
MGSRTWVVLNSNRVVSDIISKQNKITAERPDMPIASGLVSHDLRTAIRQTKYWLEGRRVMHHLLSGSVLRIYGKWYETERCVKLCHCFRSYLGTERLDQLGS